MKVDLLISEKNGDWRSPAHIYLLIVEHDVTESGKEFRMVGPADLNPHEPKTVLTCGTTKLMCTRRAESTQRNIRTNEGRQI